MLEKCFTIENNIRQFDFKTCIAYINHSGKQKYGQHFRLHAEDKEIIYKLIIYAIRAENNCAEYGIDLNKGILLTGPVGCGKTSLMNLLKLFVFPEFDYPVISTRNISSEFYADGFQVIHKYGKSRKAYCFDDLGIESNIKQFGNETNCMAEILLHRYDLQVNNGIVTHATTNLNANELEKLYGNRVRSRLRSMFNMIVYSNSSIDKRK
nr:ATPase [uncultured Fluviicola sp.]